MTGEGAFLDASLAEGFSLLPSLLMGDVLAGAPMPPRGTLEWGGRAFYRTYALTDGLVAVGALEPPFWDALCDALGEPELIGAHGDEQRETQAAERLTIRFGQLSKSEVSELLAGRDTCTSVVQTFAEMASSDHALARDLVRPAVDVPMNVTAAPFLIDGMRPPETRGAPLQGEHSNEVLAEAGYSSEEIAELIERGAVGRRP
jgi:crotonobetainyl-CoA:carnitine CoA-transferase CaiB-like acyl-CoA transferase